ncbi:hypothetical protein JCM8547_003025 [Rhodosporidiobolus lusitaniae]
MLRVSLLALAGAAAVHAAPAPAWFIAEPFSSSSSPAQATTTSAYTGPWYIAEQTTTSSTNSSMTSTASSTSSSASSSFSPAAPSLTSVISAKKGAGVNDERLARNLAISWVYDWQATPREEVPDGMEYIPMLWGLNNTNWLEDAQTAIDNGATALLAQNEPDIYSQSAVNVGDAQQSWLTNFSPFAGTGVKLISPAVSNDPKSGSIGWLEDFLGNQTQVASEVDGAALHYYSDDFNVTNFKTYFTDAYARLQKPLWITEFGVQRLTMSSNVTQKAEWLKEVVAWCEDTDFSNATLTTLGQAYSDAH